MQNLKNKIQFFLLSPKKLIFQIFFDRLFYHLFFKYYYKAIFKSYGQNIRWGRDFQFKCIPGNIRISSPQLIEISDQVKIDQNCYLQCHDQGGGIFIGKNTRVNEGVFIQSYSPIYIEDKVLIAPHCLISSGNHGQIDKKTAIMDSPYLESGPIHIQNGCWLGHGVKILGGVKLGPTTTVAAGAVVTKSFQNSKLLAGIPAREIKSWK